jgi:hypothetical protein
MYKDLFKSILKKTIICSNSGCGKEISFKNPNIVITSVRLDKLKREQIYCSERCFHETIEEIKSNPKPDEHNMFTLKITGIYKMGDFPKRYNVVCEKVELFRVMG